MSKSSQSTRAAFVAASVAAVDSDEEVSLDDELPLVVVVESDEQPLTATEIVSAAKMAAAVAFNLRFFKNNNPFNFKFARCIKFFRAIHTDFKSFL